MSFTVRSLRDLAMLQPLTLGFVPAESVIAHLIKDRGVVLTIRADIDTALDPSAFAGVVPGHVDHDTILASIVTEEPESLEWATTAVASLGPAVYDCLTIHGGYAEGSTCSSLVYPDGYTLTDEDLSLIALELVYAANGPAVTLSREELAAQYEPLGQSRPRRAFPGGNASQAAADILAGNGDIDFLAHVAVRDAVFTLVATGRASVSIEQTVSWVRQMPVQHAAPVLTVAAVIAYLAGNGTRARIAIDRALEIDPDYSLAVLLSTTLGLGVPPSDLVAIFTAVALESAE